MKRFTFFAMVVCAIISSKVVWADISTIGPEGINSQGLRSFDGITPLTGANVSIGQVEVGRAGKKNVDGTNNYSDFVNVTGVFLIDGAANPDHDISPHAENVASVMVSTDTVSTGVATGALLYSSAYQTLNNDPTSDAITLRTMQKIASQTGMRAVNNSWGQALRSGVANDGNSQLTLGMDWMASNYDVLEVKAGNEVGKNAVLPADNFNGITVGASTITDDLVFRKVANLNDLSQNPANRSEIDLIAPGDQVDVTNFNNASPHNVVLSGTSFAAPMVTGTVALLQQYGDQRQMAGMAHWDTGDYQHHQVMKAVLMNSADKINDDGTFVLPGQTNPVPQGYLLGMQKTVVMQNGTSTWFNSPAYDDDINTGDGSIALDPQMGTGALNAKRALKQLSAGEYHSFQMPNTYNEVPVIGWDYGHTLPFVQGGLNSNIYRLNQDLQGGSFISITLTFDRTVAKSGAAMVYNSGDTFTASTNTDNPGYDQYSDLDLYLMPKNSNTLSDAIAESISNTGTVEHIFFQIPTTGEYEFWVNQFNNTAGPENYAVAWWGDGVGTLTSGVGDINQDGHVDAKDIVALEKALTNETGYANSIGITTDELSLIADVNGDGKFTNADLQSLLNLLKSGGGSTSVPEPASFLLLAIGGLLLVRRRIA